MKSASTGLEYGPGVFGKHIVRIRQSHVAEHLAKLIATRRVGAAKLDLVLRGLALSDEHKGKRNKPGVVIGAYAYEDLADLCRRPAYDGDSNDPKLVRLKRKWIGNHVRLLEEMKLVDRELRRGRRPSLVVLRDDGSGKAFDQGGDGSKDFYISVPGPVIASRALADWKAPELAFFLAALIAERREANRRSALKKGFVRPPIGGGEWFQPLHWFGNRPGRRRDGGMRFPFSEATLERGLRSFLEMGLVEKRTATADPMTTRKFRSGRRNIYTNRFDLLANIHLTSSEAELRARIQAVRAGRSATA
jgi:hypothetical protein